VLPGVHDCNHGLKGSFQPVFPLPYLLNFVSVIDKPIYNTKGNMNENFNCNVMHPPIIHNFVLRGNLQNLLKIDDKSNEKGVVIFRIMP